MIDALGRIGPAASSILLEAGFWILASLLVAGLFHEFIDTDRVQALMRRRRGAALAAALGLGALLPICSCGVVPLAVGFYVGGMSVAVVMTFAAATPIINPAAVLLSYALLGPQLTIAYLLFGLTVPLLCGVLAERFGDPRFNAVAEGLRPCGCCGAGEGTAAAALPPIGARVVRALRWGLLDLGPTLGLYLGVGVLLAASVMAFVPSAWITHYLGGTSPLLALVLVALFGAVIYVCAVGHIPLVATLLSAGASPGVAIVFLVTGAVTNLPELLALHKVIGRRTVVVYVTTMVLSSIAAGWLVDLWLLPGYRSPLEPLRSLQWGDIAQRVTPIVPAPLALFGALTMAVLIAWGMGRWLVQRLPGAQRAAA
ncbi:MAG: permease [Gammaproteobacteria bacterium]